MARERWIPTDLPVSDTVLGSKVCKSDFNDLTSVGNPENGSVANVTPVQVRGS